LDSSNYKLPYYVVWRDFIGEHHELEFIVPGAHGGIKDTIDTCFSGPYHDYLKAIKEDSKKRGLPTEIEE
jgi:hypothetical protein